MLEEKRGASRSQFRARVRWSKQQAGSSTVKVPVNPEPSRPRAVIAHRLND